MSKKLFLLVLGGVAISGVLLYFYPASPVDFLRENNFGEFHVESPEVEFNAWAV